MLSRYARKNMPAPDLPLPAAIENPKISVSPMGFSGTARRRGVTKRRRRAAVRRPPWPPCLKGAVAGACDGDWGIRRSSPAKKACSFERIPPPQCSHWAPPLGKGGYARTSGVITAPMGRSYPISDNSELRIPHARSSIFRYAGRAASNFTPYQWLGSSRVISMHRTV